MERRESPAAARNRGPILEVLRGRLRGPTRVLEVGSGTGQHAAFFARSLAELDWQPSERDAGLFDSIRAWAVHEGVARPRPPLRLDATAEAWPEGPFDWVFSANVVHIAPWEVCLGLVRGAARSLGPGGELLLYGPFRIGARHTAPSNEDFDLDLRRRDPAWGVRDLEAVEAEAARRGLVLVERVGMPANNQTLVFRRAAP